MFTTILRDLPRAWRWVFNAECSESWCHQHRICWRWHVETTTCPTCGHTVTEFDPSFGRILGVGFVATSVHVTDLDELNRLQSAQRHTVDPAMVA